MAAWLLAMLVIALAAAVLQLALGAGTTTPQRRDACPEAIGPDESPRSGDGKCGIPAARSDPTRRP